MNKDFLKKIMLERGYRLEFIRYKNESGVESFCYLIMNDGNYEEYQKATKLGAIKFEDFGVVALQGEGLPTEAQKNAINIIFSE